MMQQIETDTVTVTKAVGPSSPEARSPIRNSLRQQRSIAEVAASIPEPVVPVDVEKRPGHLHRDAELGYTVTVYPTYFQTVVGLLKIVEIVSLID